MSLKPISLAAVVVAVAALCGCSGSGSNSAETRKAPEAVKAPGPDFGTLMTQPKSGQGRDQVFRVSLTANSAPSAPALIGLLVSDGASGADACYVFADMATAGMTLVRDSGSGADPIGESGSIANKQCTLLGAQSRLEKTGRQVNVSFHLQFKETFKGQKKVFTIAQGVDGSTNGLEPAGEWQVQ